MTAAVFDEAPVEGLRAWSFLTIENRQHAANDGYDDAPDRHYSWDSTVPHHRTVAEGDVCVVRTSDAVLGVARIERLEAEPTTKPRRRCPRCRATALKARASMQPRYRCASCRWVFDAPLTEVIPVTSYRADYQATWEPLDGSIPIPLLSEAYRSRATQHAIRELDVKTLREIFDARGVRLAGGWWTVKIGYDELPGGFVRTQSQRRRNQDRYRRALLERFGLRCAISGPQPADILDAAHLSRFAGDPRHRVNAGLVLRTDLHRLFDAGLLWIDDEYRIVLAGTLHGYPDLVRYHGRRLDVPEQLLPDRDHFARHRTTLVR